MAPQPPSSSLAVRGGLWGKGLFSRQVVYLSASGRRPASAFAHLTRVSVSTGILPFEPSRKDGGCLRAWPPLRLPRLPVPSHRAWAVGSEGGGEQAQGLGRGGAWRSTMAGGQEVSCPEGLTSEYMTRSATGKLPAFSDPHARLLREIYKQHTLHAVSWLSGLAVVPWQKGKRAKQPQG